MGGVECHIHVMSGGYTSMYHVQRPAGMSIVDFTVTETREKILVSIDLTEENIH